MAMRFTLEYTDPTEGKIIDAKRILPTLSFQLDDADHEYAREQSATLRRFVIYLNRQEE